MEPYRPSLDLEAMAPEARDVVERTERMLADLDSHTGRFAGANYDALTDLLDHPFMKETGLSRVEIWATLERERLSRICGYPRPALHDERYQHLRMTASDWISRSGYMREPTHLPRAKFPFIRKQVNRIKDLLAGAGMDDVRSTGGGGVSEIRFEFPAPFFGQMRGAIDIRTKYDGDTRFSIHGGFLASETVFVWGTHAEIMGTGHYHRFGLQPPAGMKYALRHDDVNDTMANMLAIILAVVSYYRSDPPD